MNNPANGKTLSPAQEWVAILMLAVTFGVVMLDRMVQLFLGPELVTEFDLTPDKIGLLASVMGICWGLSSVVFGFVSDRVGRKVVLVPAIIIFSSLSFLSGMVRSFEELLLVRAVMGLAEGPCFSVIMALSEELSATRNRGRNVGIVNSAGPLVGSAIAPIFATQIAALYGWREAFFFAGVPGIIMALLIWKFLNPPPRQSASSGHKADLRRDVKSLVALPPMWFCFIGAFALATWLFSIGVFAPLYLTSAAGMASTTSGWVLALGGFGGFLFGIFWPALTDRKIKRSSALVVLGILAAIQPLAIIAAAGTIPPEALAVLMFLTTAGPATAALVMVLIPAETVPPHLTASSIGFAVIGAEVFGASIAPFVGGKLAAAFDLSAPLYVAMAAGIVIVLVGLALAPSEGARRARAAADVAPSAPDTAGHHGA